MTLQSKQDSMAEKLKSYGDLFTTVQSESGSFLELSDLQSDIDAIGRYGEALEQLKQRGVSDTLMTEIIGMDVDDATAYTEKLLAMTDEQYSEYMALWEQKQKAAADVAQRFYSDEMTSLVNEYVSKVPDALGIMKDDLYQVGQLAAKGLAQGILSQKSAVVSAARAVAAAAVPPCARQRASTLRQRSGRFSAITWRKASVLASPGVWTVFPVRSQHPSPRSTLLLPGSVLQPGWSTASSADCRR